MMTMIQVFLLLRIFNQCFVMSSLCRHSRTNPIRGECSCLLNTHRLFWTDVVVVVDYPFMNGKQPPPPPKRNYGDVYFCFLYNNKSIFFFFFYFFQKTLQSKKYLCGNFKDRRNQSHNQSNTFHLNYLMNVCTYVPFIFAFFNLIYFRYIHSLIHIFVVFFLIAYK